MATTFLAKNKSVTLTLRPDADIDVTAIRVGKHRIARKKTSKLSSLKSAIIDGRSREESNEKRANGEVRDSDIVPSEAEYKADNERESAYVDHPVSEELDGLTFGVLKELSRLQAKGKDQPVAKQYKYKKFVAGFREVERALKRKDLKGIIVSTNLELVPEMEECLQALRDEAAVQEVPLFFSLNRRKMGKALGKSMKQSLVGIWSLEGVHQPWKQVLNLVDSLRSEGDQAKRSVCIA
jgi:ribosomal protein L7Ae-like RNA K-turn-binding protein